MLATVWSSVHAGVRDFEIDQRVRDDAVNRPPAQHAVGDQAHQAQPAAAIDEVDAAAAIASAVARGLGEHRDRSRRRAAIDGEALDVHSFTSCLEGRLRAARRNAR